MDAGRNLKLDEGKQREVIAIVATGGTRTVAAEYVGCHVSTIGRTAIRDSAFAVRLRHAESSHEILQLKNINQAAREPRYWRAAAWALERLHPDRYGARRPHMVTPEQINQALSQLTDILAAEVSDDACHRRILVQVEAVLASFQPPDEEISTEEIPTLEDNRRDAADDSGVSDGDEREPK